MQLSDNKITLYLLNYNYFEYLEHAVESVLLQSDTNFEVILIDNGSSDGSVDFMTQCCKENDWQFLQFENIPLGAVGNKVLQYSKSRYIVRLDADDWLEKDFISSMKSIIDQEAPALIFGNFYYVDGEDQIVGTHECLDRGYSLDNTAHDEPLHGACTLINREIFLLKGGYYEDFSCQDGFDLYIKMREEKISLLQSECFYYRKGHNSLSTVKSRLFDTRILIVKKYFKEASFKNPSVLYILVNDSKSIIVGKQKDRLLLLAESLNEQDIFDSCKIVIGVNDNSDNWNETGVNIEQWTLPESKQVSSSGLLKRLAATTKHEYICLVNVCEEIPPVHYISNAAIISKIFNTEGTITGYRFDQSLFRPIAGGVQQVIKEGFVKDVDRWVLHIGGITCIKSDCLTKNNLRFSLMEVDPKSLSLI